MRATVLTSLVCVAAATLPGCRPLGPPEVKTRAIAVEPLPSGDTIPASWGRLAGTSSVAQYPDLIQLWFEDDAGVVRLVVFRVTTGELINARRITRG